MHQKTPEDRLITLELRVKYLEQNLTTLLERHAALLKAIDQMLLWMDEQEGIKAAMAESTEIQRAYGRLDS